ncbi:SpoIID/LytB domain-containing protein [Georgenia sp. SYP-B2076]|uniref:SpoIID/LytB domain-containing protein n=1 Tax=Georgenia sp. SYP-B2076 TaxID=2495881 RepID=UPI000F8F700E|nr:SpoIID/LytB domain-containing protein [Georgenia sp. SYP-B2076]
MSRLRRLLQAALVGVMAVGTATIAPVTAQAAETVYTPPASGAWEVRGHGYGHGIGMSQWGARGAAQQGRSAGEILDFYYPGTTTNNIGNPQIRVQLSAFRSTAAATFWSPTGSANGVAVDGGGARVEGPGAFTVRLDAQGFVVDRTTAGGTETTRLPGNDMWVRTVDGVVAAPAGAGEGVWYRGAIRLVRTGETTYDVVNLLSMQEYLYGVVPREMPSGFDAAALQAQAVAARSYALSVSRPNASYDLCDTTACQVYGGRAAVTPAGKVTFNREAGSTNAAVDATGGQVRWYQGAVAFTQFSSSNGGHSRAGNKPYLVARPDPWSGAARNDTVHSWTAQLSVGAVQAKCPAGGTLQRLVLTSRDGRGDLGGRITGARVECTNGSTIVNTESALRFGLKSSWWVPTAAAAAPTGAGNGYYLSNSNSTGKADVVFRYGNPDDTVLVGDWDGNRSDTLAVRRGGTYHLSNSNTSGVASVVMGYGNPDDTVLVGDWDGNGTDTLAVRRGGTYFLSNSNSTGTADVVMGYGNPDDTVLVGDWDGNGTDTLAVRRGGTYFLSNSNSTGTADVVMGYGNPGDTVLVGDWDGNRSDTLAVRRGGTYFLSNSNATGVADIVMGYGNPDDITIVGDWDGNGTNTLGVRRP